MPKFTLVHGTFAANASWVHDSGDKNPDSFRARLDKALNKELTFSIPPAWGAKSPLAKIWDLTNTARLNGGGSLGQHILSEEPSDERNGKHFIIAHSHGGNVAMYALQDARVREHVDGLICLATPFLFPRARALSIATLVLSLVIMAVGVLQFTWKMNLFEQGWLAWGSASSLLLAGIFIPMFLVGVVVRQRYKRTVSGDLKLQEHIARLSYSDPQIPILLVRASGDEASGLLRSGQFLNWLGGLAMRIGRRPIYAMACAVLLLFLWMAYLEVSWLPDSTFTILSTVLIISSGVMMVLLMALTVSRVFIGLDAWPWVGELETMIEDGPPGVKSELVVITPRQPEQGLSHTEIYQQKETIDAITKWCQQC